MVLPFLFLNWWVSWYNLACQSRGGRLVVSQVLCSWCSRYRYPDALGGRAGGSFQVLLVCTFCFLPCLAPPLDGSRGRLLPCGLHLLSRADLRLFGELSCSQPKSDYEGSLRVGSHVPSGIVSVTGLVALTVSHNASERLLVGLELAPVFLRVSDHSRAIASKPVCVCSAYLPASASAA